MLILLKPKVFSCHLRVVPLLTIKYKPENPFWNRYFSNITKMGRALFYAQWTNLQFSTIIDNFLGIHSYSHIMGHFHIEHLALSCLKRLMLVLILTRSKKPGKDFSHFYEKAITPYEWRFFHKTEVVYQNFEKEGYTPALWHLSLWNVF